MKMNAIAACSFTALMAWTTVSAQSLAELARKERERRKAIESQTVHNFSNMGRTGFTPRSGSRGKASDDDSSNNGEKQAATEAASREQPQSLRETEESWVQDRTLLQQASHCDGCVNGLTGDNGAGKSSGEASQIAASVVESARSSASSAARGASLPAGPQSFVQSPTSSANRPRGMDIDGAFYVDWFRAAYAGGISSSQLSSRVRLRADRFLGEGWRATFDIRDKLNIDPRRANTFVLYDARIDYDRSESPLMLSLGQMNLYDSAGAGQLIGAAVAYRANAGLSVGGYGGLQPEFYSIVPQLDYHKYGFFVRYDGENARSLTVSHNLVRFDGATERRYLYASGLAPVGDSLMLFGNLEYELASAVAPSDRFSRAFLNARWDVSDLVDVTANYSMGKGLDYHRFLLEQSKNPNRQDPELERFYYSTQYGVRLGVKPHPRLRLFVEQRWSQQIDAGIQNNSIQIGSSAWNIVGSGLSVYGAYRMNRGMTAESDSYRLSLSRDWGPVSWTGYFSSVFNGIRFDALRGVPEIVHVPDRHTFSNQFFFPLSLAQALSVEHEYSGRRNERDNILFVRWIYRY